MRRIVSPKRLREYALDYPQAAPSLDHWEKTVLQAAWNTPADVKWTLRDVDSARVASGKIVYIFNIQRNDHRLIAAIHFNPAVVYVLRIMTHGEYSRNKWKDEL